jgi:hypothetical protein
MENEAMARQSRAADSRPEAPNITWHGSHTLEERENMIREAAYYRYLEQGCCDGHDVDDWLEAEAEVDHVKAESLHELAGHGVQQNSVHGPATDDKLKRAVRQHPRKAIAQVESIEPAEAPDRQ